MDCSKLGCNCETREYNLSKYEPGLRCRTSQPGRLLRGHLRPTLVGGHLIWRQPWANGNQNDLKNFLKKWANVQTLQLQPQNHVRNMPSAANIIIFQLSTSKTAWYQKTQDWHFAPWAFSLLIEPLKVFEGNVPGDLSGEPLPAENDCSCPADRPQT